MGSPGRSQAGDSRINLITYNLPKHKFIQDLLGMGGTPKEVLKHMELMDMMIPLLRADFQLIQTYEYLKAFCFNA